MKYARPSLRRFLRPPRFLRPSAFAVAVAGLAAGALAPAGCLSGPDPSSQDVAVPPKGCTLPPAMVPPTAPGGYYTSGGTVCTADGTPHLFHGVDRPSFEWRPDGDGVNLRDFCLMASWGANIVRIALNQDFWLSGATYLYNPLYVDNIKQAVAAAEQVGLDVILDLHWSDCGDLSVKSAGTQGCGFSGQQVMADNNSVEFWREVATTFKDDGHVLFELYNEPHNVAPTTWLQGNASAGFVVVGMQELYDTVRATGANNVVIAGGLNWAYDLSQVGPGKSPINGFNVMYATHPYDKPDNDPMSWQGSFGRLETSDFAPLIATEFGDSHAECTGDWDDKLIAFLDARHASWTAWAWYPGDCSFPALINDWNGTPTVQGVTVQQHLAGYPHTAPTLDCDHLGDAGSADAGADLEAGAQADADVDGGAEAGPDEAGDDAQDAPDLSEGGDDASTE